MIRSVKLPRRLLWKAVLLVIVSIVIVISTLRQHINRESFQKTLYDIFTHAIGPQHYDLDHNAKFNQRLDEIFDEKIKNDWTNEFWDFYEYPDEHLDVSIPSYYSKETEKPVLQPFDPRFTIAVYLNYLQQNPSHVPFHWMDWVDLSKLDRFIFASKDTMADPCTALFDISQNTDLISGSTIRSIQDYCIKDPKFELGFKITGPSGPQTDANHELLGKSYLYSSAPSPLKLVFMSNDENSYQVHVQHPNENSLDNGLLRNNLIEKLVEEGSLDPSVALNVKEQFFSLQSARKPPTVFSALTNHTIVIDEKSFDVNPHEIIHELENQASRSPLEQSYLESLQYSVAENDPPKFFYEAKLLTSAPKNWQGEHYDWRFFNGISVGEELHSITLHRLLKNYVYFARTHGLVTWIAHGSLLSWYWNGIAFPWDSDIDIQMPVGDLHKLAQHFNQSLIIEAPVTSAEDNLKFDGLGRYFVDVGSSITHRTKGNGNNNIDARFIDVDTGLYIDITGLAVTDSPVPARLEPLLDPANKITTNKDIKAYNCRNLHYNTYDELSPLVQTVVENQISYIPSNFVKSLQAEYTDRAFTNTNHRDHFYIQNLRLWITTQDILDYLAQPQIWIDVHNSSLNNPENDNVLEQARSGEILKKDVGELEKYQINRLQVEDLLNLLQNNGYLKEYIKTRTFTAFHQHEMTLLLSPKDTIKQHEKHIKSYHAGTGLHPDHFIDTVMKNKDAMNFENRVDKVLKLSDAYNL